MAKYMAKKKKKVHYIMIPGRAVLTMVLGVFNEGTTLNVKSGDRQIVSSIDTATTDKLIKVLQEFFKNTKKDIEIGP